MAIQPVILCGGGGWRLWPVSTSQRPKQYAHLISERSMLQETVLRFADRSEFLEPIIICGAGQEDLAFQQIARLGYRPAKILVEPFGRNTAAATALAALSAQAQSAVDHVLLLPADHHVEKPELFAQSVVKAASQDRGHIVTFGIRPEIPQTGFGYIHRGAALSDDLFKVEAFKEKPDLATAQRYVAAGTYDWNAGIFLFSPKVMIDELRLLAPDVLGAAEEALKKARHQGVVYHLDAAAFAKAPSISIDYAVMENTKKAAVMACDIGWADVGSWSELWRLGAKDGRGNYVRGSEAELIDCKDSLVFTDGLDVAAIGLEDMIVVVSEGKVLIAPKSRSQDVKLAVEAINSRNKIE